MSYVYFILNRAARAIKVGVSSRPSQRLRTLQCGSPVPLELVAQALGGHKEEHALHRRFRSERLSGEWFVSDRALGAFVEELRAAPPSRAAEMLLDVPRPPDPERAAFLVAVAEGVEETCFAFIRERGIDSVALMLDAVWGRGSDRPEITHRTLEAVLAGEMYFRLEWLITLVEESPAVASALTDAVLKLHGAKAETP